MLLYGEIGSLWQCTDALKYVNKPRGKFVKTQAKAVEDSTKACMQLSLGVQS